MDTWLIRKWGGSRLGFTAFVSLCYASTSYVLLSSAVAQDKSVAAETGFSQSAPAGLASGAEESATASKAGLISVVGGNQHKRSAILSIADKMRAEIALICGNRAVKLELPITVQLVGEKGGVPKSRGMVTKIEKVEGVYYMKLYIHLANTMDHELLRYHLMELFLYERGLRDGAKVVADERLLVKPWLIVGMLEAIKIKRGEEDKGLYQADIDYLASLSVARVFDASEGQFRDMLGVEPLAFRAISGAMVSSLLRQPKGKQYMNAYLADFATFKGEPDSLLRRHFPGMNKSQNSLVKWVNLEMLELGTADVTQVFSIMETDKRLESHLNFRYRDEENVLRRLGIDDYEKLMNLSPNERAAVVRSPLAEMSRLSYRCFPEYRPIIYEYMSILSEVSAGKAENVGGRLAALSETRQRMRKAGERVRDYLDWYYITRANQVGSDFKQYRDVSQRLRAESEKLPANDRLKSYLESVEKIFGNE